MPLDAKQEGPREGEIWDGIEVENPCSGGIWGQVTGISSPYFGDVSGTRRRCVVLRSASLLPGTGHTCHSVIPKKEPTTNDRAKLWACPCPPSFICSQGDCRADILPPCSQHCILYSSWPWTSPSSLASLASPGSISPLLVFWWPSVPLGTPFPQQSILTHDHWLSYSHMRIMCSCRLSTSECTGLTCARLTQCLLPPSSSIQCRWGRNGRDGATPHRQEIRKYTRV